MTYSEHELEFTFAKNYSINACLLFISGIDSNNAIHNLTSIFIFLSPLYLYSVVDMTVVGAVISVIRESILPSRLVF